MTKKEIILKKENGRIPYLTELLEDNKIGTNTILCKTLTGLGATYSEIKAPRHSIIIEPNRPVITGKCKDPEHKNDNLFGVYQGIFTDDIIVFKREERSTVSYAGISPLIILDTKDMLFTFFSSL